MMRNKMSRFIIYGAIGLMIALLLVQCMNRNGDLPKVNYESVGLTQLDGPSEGQEIAVIKTTLGEFRAALYRDYAPKTVEFFVENAKKGFYDGKYFYGINKGMFFMFGTARQDGYLIEKDQVISDGDTDTEGKYDKETYDIEQTINDNEIMTDLWTFKGALISVGPNYKGTGAFVVGVGSDGCDDETYQKLLDQENANADLVNAYKEHEGILSLAQGDYTVFAQVYEGMDVYDAILNVDSDSKTGLPVEELKIISITIENYLE